MLTPQDILYEYWIKHVAFGLLHVMFRFSTRISFYRGYSILATENWTQKKSREKWNLWPKRSNSVRIGSFSTPKDHFGIGGWEKVPQKDRVQSPECKNRGSKRRHIHITQHSMSTLPGPPVCLSIFGNLVWNGRRFVRLIWWTTTFSLFSSMFSHTGIS